MNTEIVSAKLRSAASVSMKRKESKAFKKETLNIRDVRATVTFILLSTSAQTILMIVPYLCKTPSTKSMQGSLRETRTKALTFKMG
jgi:hypothetical protein